MKVKGRLLLRMAEFCPTLLSTCAAASSARGKEEPSATTNPRRQAVPQASSTSPLQRAATSLGTSARSRALPREADELSPVPLANPCAQVSAPHLPQPPRKATGLSLVPPKRKLAQPQPTAPYTPAWILPFCVEAGTGGAGAAEQTGGHTREGKHPNLPKNPVSLLAVLPPSPPTPSRPSRARSHPGLARGHGQAVTQRGQGHAGHRHHEREGEDAGGPRGGVILTAFACHRHLQLQAGFTMVVDGLGCEGRGRLGREGWSLMAIPCSTSEPPLQPPSTHRCSNSCAPP